MGYMDEKLKTSAKAFNLDLVNSFAKFQACYFAASSLNKLFGSPFRVPSFHKLYNGTFVYNMTTHLGKVRSEAVNWGSEKVNEHFNNLAESVLKLLQNVHHNPGAKSKRTKSGKMKNTFIVIDPNMSCDDQNEHSSGEDSNGNGFFDTQNKFAALAL